MVACFPASGAFVLFVKCQALRPPLIIKPVRSVPKGRILRVGNRIFRDLERFDVKRTRAALEFHSPSGDIAPNNIRQTRAVNSYPRANITVSCEPITNLGPAMMFGIEVVEFLKHIIAI